MPKYISDLLHRLPWWGLTGFGLDTLAMLVSLAVPVTVLRIEARGRTPAEVRAIQREMDAAFGVNTLGRADSLVRTIQRMASDPVRRAELDRALDEIARAREDVISGANIRNHTRAETTTTVDGVIVEHHIDLREDPEADAHDDKIPASICIEPIHWASMGTEQSHQHRSQIRNRSQPHRRRHARYGLA